MARQRDRPLARRRRGDPPLDLDAGPLALSPQFTQLTFAGIEVACWDALGRALGVPTRTFFGGRVRDEVDYFGFLQGDDPEQLAAHARELAAAGYEVHLPEGRPRRARRRRVRRRGARGDRPRRAAAHRPERGVGRRDGGRADPAARAVRPRLGRAAGARRRRERAWRTCAARSARRSRPTRRCSRRASCSQVLERRPPTWSSRAAHDAGGLLRFRQQAFARARPTASRQPARVHGERGQLLANAAGRLDDPEPDHRQPGDAPAARRAADARAAPPDARRAAAAVPDDAPGHGFELDHDAVGVAHERWQRDGAYNTIDARRHHERLRPGGSHRLRRRRVRRRRRGAAPDLGSRPALRRRDLRGHARSSTGRCSARATTSRGSSARRARSGSSSRSVPTSCST